MLPVHVPEQRCRHHAHQRQHRGVPPREPQLLPAEDDGDEGENQSADGQADGDVRDRRVDGVRVPDALEEIVDGLEHGSILLVSPV